MEKVTTYMGLTDKICCRITDYILSGELSNEDLVQIIEHTGSYLNLATRSEWARQNGKSYNAGKKFRKNIRLFGATFVIDNL